MATEKEKKDLTTTEILENEDSILNNLFKASEFKNDEQMQKKVVIKRNGEAILEFTIRPLSQTEFATCHDKATKKIVNPTNAKLPLLDGKTDPAKAMSYRIYTATIDSDKKKIWDNDEFKKAKNIINGADSVDLLLMAGEKVKVDDMIDEISGFNSQDYISEEEYAKN